MKCVTQMHKIQKTVRHSVNTQTKFSKRKANILISRTEYLWSWL